MPMLLPYTLCGHGLAVEGCHSDAVQEACVQWAYQPLM